MIIDLCNVCNVLIILVVNCTDPIGSRTDIEAVNWNGSLHYEMNVTIRCTTFGKAIWYQNTWQDELSLVCGADKKWAPSSWKCEWNRCFDPPAPTPDLEIIQVTPYDPANPPYHNQVIRYTQINIIYQTETVQNVN